MEREIPTKRDSGEQSTLTGNFSDTDLNWGRIRTQFLAPPEVIATVSHYKRTFPVF